MDVLGFSIYSVSTFLFRYKTQNTQKDIAKSLFRLCPTVIRIIYIAGFTLKARFDTLYICLFPKKILIEKSYLKSF